jgi:signal transduction histidine kinase
MIMNAAQSIQEKIDAGSEQRGKITISTCADENKVMIKIQDTGKGIPESIQQRIFDPFFTTKGVGKGTGQGLSMAHNIIVKKHQGKIIVDSIENEGTIFTIELPVDSSRQETG